MPKGTLSPEEIVDMYLLRQSGKTLQSIAAKYGFKYPGSVGGPLASLDKAMRNSKNARPNYRQAAHLLRERLKTKITKESPMKTIEQETRELTVVEAMTRVQQNLQSFQESVVAMAETMSRENRQLKHQYRSLQEKHLAVVQENEQLRKAFEGAKNTNWLENLQKSWGIK